MTETFYIKKGDTSPAIQYTLAPSPIDLTGATVVFSMRLRNDASIKVNKASATIVAPAAGGVVRYDWDAADTDAAGVYEAEFEVTFADSSVETFPNYGYIGIHIERDLA